MTRYEYLKPQDKIIDCEMMVSHVLGVTSARGVDKNKVLRGTGIFEEDIMRQTQISSQQLQRLLGNAESLTPGHDCSFQIGRSIATDLKVPVFRAVKFSRTLSEALRILNCYRAQWNPLLSVMQYEDNDSLYWFVQDAFGASRSHQFFAELYLTLLVSLIKQWSGKRAAMTFEFGWDRPRYIHEYEENLGYRISFGHAQTRVVLEKQALSLPFLQDSTFLRRVALSQCKVRGRSASLLDYIRGEVRKRPTMTLQDIADSLAMSSATLKRKLKEQHVSYRQLADEIGRQQAYFYLNVKKYSNEKSALTMAFSDINNFRRSVKRWTGLTPSELRGV